MLPQRLEETYPERCVGNVCFVEQSPQKQIQEHSHSLSLLADWAAEVCMPQSSKEEDDEEQRLGERGVRRKTRKMRKKPHGRG
jgi:hypothetical protein